jgi:hypothetical protein
MGASTGLQFHPEVNVGIVSEWVRVYGHELAAQGVDGARLVAEAELPAVAVARVARLMRGLELAA